MSNCYICEQEITKENKYTEHIILNSIGGRLTSLDLTCEKCARDLDHLDNELYKPLQWIAVELNIKRDRGKPKPFLAKLTATGQDIMIHPNGRNETIKPYINDKPIGEGTIDWLGKLEIKASASDKKQSEQALKKLKKERPGITDAQIKQLLENATIVEEKTGKIDVIVSFDENCLRAICKMAINFYMHQDSKKKYIAGDRKYITHLIPYLMGENQKLNYVNHYYPSVDKIPNYLERDNKVVHSLLIKGDTENKCLYGLIQLFSSWQFLILLNDNYQGKELSKSYVFDVLARTEIEDSLDLKMSRQEIESVLNTCLTEENLSLFDPLVTKKRKLINLSKKRKLLDNLENELQEILSSGDDKFNPNKINEQSRKAVEKMAKWTMIYCSKI